MDPSWKIGRYIAITMVPIIAPMKTIRKGSIKDVRVSRVASI
jgi:hypothetical protein